MNILHWARLVISVFALLHAEVGAASGKLEELSPRAAPPLELADLDGRRHDLKAHRGKVVLVNFWATWCEPCREEMPSIQRLRDRMGDRRFAVLLVNVDEPQTRVRRYVEEARLELPTLVDAGKRATRDWSVKVLPASFLVAPDGRVRYRSIGDIDWNSARAAVAIERLLAGR
jgi:thiol-disulfide isomerase/thioredoxin